MPGLVWIGVGAGDVAAAADAIAEPPNSSDRAMAAANTGLGEMVDKRDMLGAGTSLPVNGRECNGRPGLSRRCAHPGCFAGAGLLQGSVHQHERAVGVLLGERVVADQDHRGCAALAHVRKEIEQLLRGGRV